MVWKDKNKRKLYNAEYYKNNRLIIRENQRIYNIITNEKQTERKRKSYDPIKRKQRTIKEKDKTSIQGKQYRKKNKERIKIYQQEFNQRPERKAYIKNWQKNNPRKSHGGSYTLELELAMNNVRIRDKNTCQWYGCGLSFKDGFPIHVHHIFPKKEYPELMLIEKFMLCYCLNHHYMWHKYRGDKAANILKPKDYEKERELNV